jgi:cytochrome c-type biogenesis protein CcmH
MLFWILAAIGLALATFVSCLPLFRQKTGWTPIALALVFAVPAGALMVYKNIGAPEAIDMVSAPARNVATHEAGESAELDDLVGNLRARLTEDSESLDGWILLARTLKSMQRYSEALEALETANRIAPDNPFVIVELVETRIFVSPQGLIDAEMVAMLQAALTADPNQQKALWLLGIAASQAGEDEAAISYWETLSKQLEPETTIAQSVGKQIDMARARLGLETEDAANASPFGAETGAETQTAAEPEPPVESQTGMSAQPPAIASTAAESSAAAMNQPTGETWTGTDLRVSFADGIQPQIPSSAVLWVMIRTAGPVAGPPLGVRRVIGPTLPLELTISDQDSMMKERLISLQLQARLSLSGAPQARSGDWQTAPMTVPLDSSETLELVIDQQVE